MRKFLWPLVLLATASAANAMSVDGISCEYRADPLGVDVAQPRLGWVLQSSVRGDRVRRRASLPES